MHRLIPIMDKHPPHIKHDLLSQLSRELNYELNKLERYFSDKVSRASLNDTSSSNFQDPNNKHQDK